MNTVLIKCLEMIEIEFQSSDCKDLLIESGQSTLAHGIRNEAKYKHFKFVKKNK